jgi:PAS domain S-box-containing protein
MNFIGLSSPRADSAVMRAPAYIGPLIPSELWPLRYLAAVAIVIVTVAVRAALAPLLGTQAPLLPFVLAVFVSAHLGGRGPGLLASILTPVAATIWFTTWPHDAPPLQWLAHVLFFMAIAVLATLLMHELQTRARAQLAALRAAAESAGQAMESASQLRLIADAMPALISYITPDYTYRFVNRMYQTWFGLGREQLMGRHLREVLGAEAWELLQPRLERVFRGERVFLEAEIPYQSGAREVAAHYIPDVDSDGKVRGCYALIEDVSARKRAERALRENDRRKDEFLAILAHELRNPLTPVRNVAHILAKGRPDAATVRRSGEMLGRQATLLTHMVDDLLDVARIMRGRVALDREPLRLLTVVETALETVRPLLEARHQTVSVSRLDSELFVDADNVRLCQVVSNLLNNAIKYSPERARIEIALEGLPGRAALVVRDEGVGIDPQMLPHVFDVFQQGDRSLDRSHGGLGIGLTVVRHLVEQHGGRVQVKSEGLGKGSEFRIELPRVPAPPKPIFADGAAPVANPAVRRRVLVVDDNRDAAESLRELLKMSGHDVKVVSDGASALSRLDDFRADIVLLDIGLPRMDGFMVAHAIRARFAHPHVRPRLFALTGHGREEERNSALRSGFDGYLTKPLEPEALLRLIADEGQHQIMSSEQE